MRFKTYLSEGIVIPNKIKITTNNIDKLNDQFQDTIITFMDYVDSMDEMRASYIPELEEIEVYIHKDAPHNTIEALVQHELIHSIQDNKSGMLMVKEENKRRDKIDKVTKKIKKLNITCPVDMSKATGLCKELSDLENERAFLNHQEYMTYAMMFVKMRKSENQKTVLKDASEWWKKVTGKKLNKKLLKYFASYWVVRKEL